MTDRFCTVLSGCMCTWMMFVPAAEAADGRITFSGRIVVPTCHVATDTSASAQASVAPRRSYRQSCAELDSPMSSPRTHVVTVRRLTHAESDRVLKYFYGYLSASRVDAAPMLVTQTYE